MKSTRRQFMMVSAVSVATLATAKVAYAQPMLAETDAQAVALGYFAVAANVNKTKFPKYKDDQLCSNCQLYSAKTDVAGACSIFPGKLVAGPGWCNLWIKKAG
jgi:High potential iron-sulfur protein.